MGTTSLPMIFIISLAGLAAWGLWRWWLLAQRVDRPLAVTLMTLRAVILALLLLAVTNPGKQYRARTKIASETLLLLDASASMNLPAEDNGTRWEQVQKALARHKKSPGLTTCYFAAGLIPFVPPKPSEQVTDIALALSQITATATQPPQRLVVISDGQQTRGDAVTAARRLHGLGVIVDTIGVGSRKTPVDAAILSVQAPAVVKEHQPFPIAVTVATAGKTTEVRVFKDEELMQRLPCAPAAKPTTCKSTLPGLPVGTYLFTAVIPSMPNEATATNNQRSFIIEVRRDQNKVALVAVAPSPEYANLRRVLQDLPRTELQAWVRLRPDQYLSQTQSGSRSVAFSWANLLKNNHVVLLADLKAAETEGTAVTRFLNEGGAVGLLGGTTGWENITPLMTGTYQPVPTSTGLPEKHTALGADLLATTGSSVWLQMPPLTGTSTVTSVNSAAEVALRTRDGRPLLATRSQGLGRVLSLATDATYRWILSPEADAASRRLHRTFWTTLVSWLAQPPDASQVILLLDPPVSAYGQPVRALVQVNCAGQPVNEAQVTVSVRSGKSELHLPASLTTTPGRYQVALSQLKPGKHEVLAKAIAGTVLGTARRSLMVEPGGAETAELTRQEGVLKQIAQAGGGQYVELGDLKDLLTQSLATPVFDRQLLSYPFRSLWLYLTVLILLGCDWFLRRQRGL